MRKDLATTAAAVRSASASVDLFETSLLQKVFHPNTFRESLLRQVEGYKGSGKPLPIRLGLIKVEGLDGKLRERLEREALSRQLRTFEQKALAKAGASLVALNLALTVDKLALKRQ